MFLIGLLLISIGMFSDLAVRKLDPDKLPDPDVVHYTKSIDSVGQRLLRCDSFSGIFDLGNAVLLKTEGGHIYVFDMEGKTISHLYAPNSGVCDMDDGFAICLDGDLYFYSLDGNYKGSMPYSKSDLKIKAAKRELTLSNKASFIIKSGKLFQELQYSIGGETRVIMRHFHLSFSPIRIVEVLAFLSVIGLSLVFVIKNIDVFLSWKEKMYSGR